jgi:hypothetical protein
MAFTGVAVVTKVSDSVFLVTGLSLAGDASGTIGFSDKTVAPEVELTAPDWQPRSGLTLSQLIEVRQTIVTDVTAAVPISVVKTGTSHEDFVITMHNDSAATVSPALAIWIEFH